MLYTTCYSRISLLVEACILVTWRQESLSRSHNFMEAPKQVSYEQVQHVANVSESKTCPWVFKRCGLLITGQSASPHFFLPHYCGVFQCRCTMMSYSNSIKGGSHLNFGHFLLVSWCVSLMEVCRHNSSGKGAFPSVASTSIVEAVLLLISLK